MALVDGGDLVVRAIKQEGVDTIFISAPGMCRGIYDWKKQVLGHHVEWKKQNGDRN